MIVFMWVHDRSSERKLDWAVIVNVGTVVIVGVHGPCHVSELGREAVHS
jgi:hypothetical protein